jgi:hypothetical protein
MGGHRFHRPLDGRDENVMDMMRIRSQHPVRPHLTPTPVTDTVGIPRRARGISSRLASIPIPSMNSTVAVFSMIRDRHAVPAGDRPSARVEPTS